jgi:hypothetical protein
VAELGFTTGRALDDGSSTSTLRPRLTPIAALDAGQVVVYDLGNRRHGAVAAATTSGHVWTSLTAAVWLTDTNGRTYNSSAVNNAKLQLDAGASDVEVGAGIVYGTREGLLLRLVDNNNYALVRIDNTVSQIQIVSVLAGAAEVVHATVAFTPTVGRRYHLSATIYGNVITVFLDGQPLALTHTLTGGVATALTGSTKHGLFSHSPGLGAGKFDNFYVKKLTA